VRVVRGAHAESPYAPKEGFRYDGLYVVTQHWSEHGKSGFLIWRFQLRRDDATAPPWEVIRVPGPPGRRLTTTQRIIRNTAEAVRVKELYGHRCQMCGLRLETPGGPYAEGAHIKPLGAPHHGPDVLGNLLCVCANCHVLFDSGAIRIAADMSLIGRRGQLRMVRAHRIRDEYLLHHRERFPVAPAG